MNFPAQSFVVAVSLSLLLSACAAQKTAPLQAPSLSPVLAQQPSSPPLLVDNHFRRDGTGSVVSEEALKLILAAPVFLEEGARVGIVPVRDAYTPEKALPLAAVPAGLAAALDDSGMFELAYEVSTDFPADGGVSGLRELAARYRADYLLLYRHRFAERGYANAAIAFWATGVGALFAPGRTLEAAGVLEATLFDVKTGTLLFTVQERIGGTLDINALHPKRKAEALQRRLLEQAGERLSEGVVHKMRRLAAARPEAGKDGLLSSSPMSETSIESAPLVLQVAR